jgi:hypothetical protein
MAWTTLLPLVLFPALGVFGTHSIPASLGRSALSYVDQRVERALRKAQRSLDGSEGSGCVTYLPE